MKKIEFIIFIRSLRKHKTASIFKIFGLSVGIASVMLVIAFAHTQLSFDQFHKDAADIYRIEMEYVDRNGQVSSSPMVAPLVAEHTLHSASKVNMATRLFSYSWKEEALVEAGSKRFYESKFILTDPSFFQLFSFNLIAGNKEHMFAEPNTVVLSQSCSKRYFGDEDPIGKTIRVTNFGNLSLVVIGIIEDAPENSHFSFDILAPLSLGEKMYWKPFLNTWFGMSFYTYIKIDGGVNPAVVEESINEIIRNAADPRLGEQSYTLVPITSIHLYSDHTTELEKGGDVIQVVFAILSALIIFLICLSNYSATTISQIYFRAREAGVKKLLGRSRLGMSVQVFVETLIFSFSGYIIALILLEVFSPIIISILGIDLSAVSYGRFILSGILLILVFSFSAGLSPSILYSRYKTADSLKEQLLNRGGKVSLRSVMFILQFIILSVLLTATFFVGSQHDLLTGDQAGLELSNILIIPLRDHHDIESYEAFKNDLEKIAGIDRVSYSSSMPINASSIIDVYCEGYEQAFKMVHIDVGAGLPEVYGMKLKAGRFFDSRYKSDNELAYIINETAAKMLGWTAVEGQKINYSNEMLRFAEFKEGILIGIVEDFHHSPKHKGIQPLVMKIRENLRYISVSYFGEDHDTIAAVVSSVFERSFGASVHSLRLAEETNQDLYSTEKRMANIFYFCTFLAMILAIFSAISISKLEMKIKYREFGIRKVFGAGVWDLLDRSIRQYLIMVSLAYSISIPIVIFFMHKWLSRFAYSIDFSIGYFLIAFFIILISTLVIIIVQILKASGSDPVNILRNE